MKVLMVNNLLPPFQVGGAERSVAELVHGLSQRGVDVATYSLVPGKAQTALSGTERRIAIQRRFWPFAGEHRSLTDRLVLQAQDLYRPDPGKAFEAALHDLQPTVVHTHNLKGIGSHVWMAAKAAGVPVVHTLRDYELVCPLQGFHRGLACGHWYSPCRLRSLPHLYRSKSVDHVVGISRHILKAHLDLGYFPRAGRSVIANQPKLGSVPPRPMGGRPRFGYIGHLGNSKGFGYLARVVALPAIRELLADPVLVAGDQPARLLHDWQALNPPGLELAGRLEIEEFLAQVDVVIVPSIWNEPFGRVAAEGRAAGRIVVASDRGGLPEALAGYSRKVLFTPTDEEALAAAMRRAVAMHQALPPLQPTDAAMAGPSVEEQYLTVYRQLGA